MTTEITVASDQTRANVFAEVRVHGNVLADVIYDVDGKTYLVTTYSGPDDDWVGVDLVEFLRALVSAKEALVLRGFPDLAV